MVRMRASCSSMSCDRFGPTSLEVCREPGGEVALGDEARWIGDVARSRPFGIGGVAVMPPGVPGNGGKGIEGGGAGKAVVPPDLRVEACDPDRASAIAAASGESDSRL